MPFCLFNFGLINKRNMRKIYILIIILIFTIAVNAQDDSTKQRALSINASYIGEIISNLTGGIRTGSVYEGMGNFMFEYDTKKAGLWKGGKIYINAAHTHGGDASKSFIGDFQVASNIEADNLTYFHEMFFSQEIGRAQFIIGLQDLNAEFAASENASMFLNSSFGVHSTIADNIVAPIFPLTAFGLQIKYNIHSRLAIKLITFDGFPDDFSKDNPYNLHWKFTKEDGLLNIAEISWHPRINERLEGGYSLGSYTHHHISKDDNHTSEFWEITNYGFYIVADQTLAIMENGSTISSFLQASVSPSQKNENWYYLGTGINYSNIFSRKRSDLIGLAIAHAGFAKPQRDETAIELSYQYPLTDQITIQPDIQLIINPSGTEYILKNALVTRLRFIVSL